MHKYLVCLCMFAFSYIHAIDTEWIKYSFQAARFEKEDKIPEAIDEYTKAIDEGETQVSDYLNLYIARGSLYIAEGFKETQKFEKATQDFNFVLNHPKACKNDKIEALALRARVYLFLKKYDEFGKDVLALDQIDPLVVKFQEDDNFVIFKMGQRWNEQEKLAWTISLLKKKFIESKDDIIFTEAGLASIKKSAKTKKSFKEIALD